MSGPGEMGTELDRLHCHHLIRQWCMKSPCVEWTQKKFVGLSHPQGILLKSSIFWVGKSISKRLWVYLGAGGKRRGSRSQQQMKAARKWKNHRALLAHCRFLSLARSKLEGGEEWNESFYLDLTRPFKAWKQGSRNWELTRKLWNLLEVTLWGEKEIWQNILEDNDGTWSFNKMVIPLYKLYIIYVININV